MDSSLIKKIIFDYFDGKYTSIQRKSIEEWLGQEGNIELFHQYLDEWESKHPQCEFNLEEGLKKVTTNIDKPAYKIDSYTGDGNQIRYAGLFKWLVAASAILVFTWLGWVYFTSKTFSSQDVVSQAIRAADGNIYEKENLTNEPILVNLPDKSSVVLQPRSRLSYVPKEFNKQVRKVFLSGEAFFEVHKNKKIPFYVYANGFIASVVGTSFFVNTDTKYSEVVVKTGRVTVFLEKDLRKYAPNSKELKGVFLKANERLDLSSGKHLVEKKTALEQDKLKLPIQTMAFSFDESSAEDVFNDLNKAYNAQIVYDSERMKNCKLTARLSDEPLLEKIELICIALEATFKVENDQIVIQSNGCR